MKILGTGPVTGDNVQALSAAQAAQAVANIGATGAYYGKKNYLINGSMVVASRPANSGVLTSTATYTNVDRWKLLLVSGTHSSGALTQSNTAPAGFAHGYALGGTSIVIGGSGAVLGFRQYIHPEVSGRMQGKKICLSGLVYQNSGQSLTGTFKVYSATAANNFSSVTLIATGGAQTVTSGVNVAVAAIVDVSAAANLAYGVMVEFDLAYGASAASHTLLVGNMQVEDGTIATPFDWRPIGHEMFDCRRYYQLNYVSESRYGSSGGNYNMTVSFQTMIGTPTMAGVSVSSTAGTLTSVTPSALGPSSGTISIGTSSGGDWGLYSWCYSCNCDY